ncbi:MAG: hypothetical protein IJ274_15105 [Lachnospiraceae bacterium]|nr:hypothetical protein [Lentisphaeria bacterium]MBQ8041169.1 hypothetical protein [Lachnospiraceae bacterium]
MNYLSSKKSDIPLTLFLWAITLGIWGICLDFQLCRNINYLNQKEKYNPWLFSWLAFSSILQLLFSGIIFLDIIFLIIEAAVAIFFTAEIAKVSPKPKNENSGAVTGCYFLIGIGFLIDIIGAFDDYENFFLSIVSLIIWLIFYGILLSLFNSKLESAKNTTFDSKEPVTPSGVWGMFFVQIIAVFLMFLFAPGKGEDITVDEVREHFKAEMNQELSSPDHPIRRKVESAQKVNVHTAYVSTFQIITKDGSNLAVSNGEFNIQKVIIRINTRWSGFIETGYTDITYPYENINGELILNENGISINTSDSGITLGDVIFTTILILSM